MIGMQGIVYKDVFTVPPRSSSSYLSNPVPSALRNTSAELEVSVRKVLLLSLMIASESIVLPVEIAFLTFAARHPVYPCGTNACYSTGFHQAAIDI